MNAINRTLATPDRATERSNSREVKNSAGGYVYSAADKDRLERFLILGTDGGTYYVGERELTKQNINFVVDLIGKDETLVRETVTAVSTEGRAYRNDPAIFAVVALLAHGKDHEANRAAFVKVVRTATHLYSAAEMLTKMTGWGRGKRKAFAGWFEAQTPEQLAYQAVKYRQRNGWTLRDVMRLVHPKGVNPVVGNFILKGEVAEHEGAGVISGFQQVQAAQSTADVVRTLGTYSNLPWETIPTAFLKDPAVWKTLFYNGQVKGQALVRNVTRMARIGAFDDLQFAGDYAKALTDESMIRKTRLHPINFLNALVVYNEGQFDRSGGGFGWYTSYGRKKDWRTTPVIADALDAGFHAAFKTIEPANKRTLIGLDVSGSMGQAANGIDLTCSQVSAAVAMTVARTEPYYDVRGFSTEFRDLGITPRQPLNQVVKRISGLTFGGTDCSLPMVWAAQNKVEIDTFVVITDNETWSGGKPVDALRRYRSKMGIDARLAVMGVSATDFTIADPQDRGMMDFVGFDSNAPRVLADFSAGRI